MLLSSNHPSKGRRGKKASKDSRVRSRNLAISLKRANKGNNLAPISRVDSSNLDNRVSKGNPVKLVRVEKVMA